MKTSVFFAALFLFYLSSIQLQAQGISESPPRVFFTQQAGTSGSQRIRVNNPSKVPIELGVSVGDWEYDSLGNNVLLEAGKLEISCAKWLQILPGSYFTLQPGEQQWVTVNMNVPQSVNQDIPVHTAMVYLTQLNGSDGKAQNGANIKIRVQMGVKIYQSFPGNDKKDVEVMNFQDTTLVEKDKKSTRALCLQLKNTGNLWLEGKIKWEILNEQTGKTIKLDPIDIYSLPGDNRYILRTLPDDLTKGKYSVTAIINYGDKNDLKTAELEFAY